MKKQNQLKSIRSLEIELGKPLFTKHAKKILDDDRQASKLKNSAFTKKNKVPKPNPLRRPNSDIFTSFMFESVYDKMMREVNQRTKQNKNKRLHIVQGRFTSEVVVVDQENQNQNEDGNGNISKRDSKKSHGGPDMLEKIWEMTEAHDEKENTPNLNKLRNIASHDALVQWPSKERRHLGHLRAVRARDEQIKHWNRKYDPRSEIRKMQKLGSQRIKRSIVPKPRSSRAKRAQTHFIKTKDISKPEGQEVGKVRHESGEKACEEWKNNELKLLRTKIVDDKKKRRLEEMEQQKLNNKFNHLRIRTNELVGLISCRKNGKRGSARRKRVHF